MTKHDAELKSFVDRIPKVELHAHLNGCIRTSTLFDLANERGIKLSEHHFGDEGVDDDVGHMYNSKPRSLVDCFDMFAEVTKVVSDLPALQRITWEALQDFSVHHVAYLEIRSTPKRLKRQWDSDEITSKREYVDTILSVFKELEQRERVRFERESKDFKESRLPLIPRLIVSIDRSRSVEEALENVNLAISLHESRNEYLVGVDLGGNPLKNDFRHFEASFLRARESGLKVTLHCGEVQCAENGNDVNPKRVVALQEARAVIMFKPDRLGHALLLPRSLRPELSNARIPVECCPTSNVMTLELASNCQGYLVDGLRSHPQLEHWLQTDYPISISTDDSGVFNTNPSKELLLVGLAWNLTPSKLSKIVFQSIEHAFCDDDTKTLLRNRMTTSFSSSKTVLNPPTAQGE